MFDRTRQLCGLVLLLVTPLWTGAQASSRIELPMLQRGVQPMVEVMVDGEGPFRFAIDTGGQGKARADASLVEKLKLPKVGEARGGDPSGKNTVAMDIVRMASVKLGALELKDVDAPSRDYRRGPGEGIDGILGFQFFADHLLTLDYKNKKVILEKGALDAKDENVVKFTAPRGIPVVTLSIAGKTVEAHVDTGNMVAPFLTSAEFAAGLPLKGEPKVVGRARTVSNEFEIKEAAMEGDVLLAKQRYINPVVRFPSPAREANIGSAAFEGKIITFDQKNGLMRITAN